MIAQQTEFRANMKRYLEIACSEEPIIIPRKEGHNVVVLSEKEYNRLLLMNRMKNYADAIGRLSSPTHEESAAADDVRSFNLNKLSVIADLKDDWNGNGAPAMPRNLIDRARLLIECLEIQPELFPTAMQTIQFEFDNSRRDHMEIEVGLADTAEVFQVCYNGAESFEELPIDPAVINARVRSFYG